MAVQFSARSAGGRRRRAYRAMADINMTPFIDIMLVLLIVFMVTAPLLTVGVPVDLPKTNASPIQEQKDPIYVTVQRDGSVFVQETRVSVMNDLVPKLNELTGGNPEARILVRGDAAITYGEMLTVMATMSTAGFKKVGLVAALPDGAPYVGPKAGDPAQTQRTGTSPAR
jgi:biopolymer transport protein TolR